MNTEKSPLEKMNSWIKNSVMLKLLTIIILMLLLLIPTGMIKSIIAEREHLQEKATHEVGMKWSGPQGINGPYLTIPMVYSQMDDEKEILITKYLHILPEKLNIDATAEPETLERGIYKVVVYRGRLNISGNFKLNIKADRTDLKEILYDQAFLTIGISELSGIEDQLFIQWGNDLIRVESGTRIPEIVASGITADLPDLSGQSLEELSFSLKINLQGSQNLSFIPLGNTTLVNLRSSWNSPSFDGNFLPDSRQVTDTGFNASWKILQLNRNYPQSWTGNNYESDIHNSSFGVNLILPVDNYQQAMRSVKYSVMSIALTFLIFFLVEILNKRKIHPFQYALVGLALCLFYILLVSISEHLNFNLAYLISSLAIILMISLYSLSVFKKIKLTFLLLFAISALYVFLFVTLQLADYALLMGSAGLTIILAATMYFTRNINWYRINRTEI